MNFITILFLQFKIYWTFFLIYLLSSIFLLLFFSPFLHYFSSTALFPIYVLRLFFFFYSFLPSSLSFSVPFPLNLSYFILTNCRSMNAKINLSSCPALHSFLIIHYLIPHLSFYFSFSRLLSFFLSLFLTFFLSFLLSFVLSFSSSFVSVLWHLRRGELYSSWWEGSQMQMQKSMQSEGGREVRVRVQGTVHLSLRGCNKWQTCEVCYFILICLSILMSAPDRTVYSCCCTFLWSLFFYLYF